MRTDCRDCQLPPCRALSRLDCRGCCRDMLGRAPEPALLAPVPGLSLVVAGDCREPGGCTLPLPPRGLKAALPRDMRGPALSSDKLACCQGGQRRQVGQTVHDGCCLPQGARHPAACWPSHLSGAHHCARHPGAHGWGCAMNRCTAQPQPCSRQSMAFPGRVTLRSLVDMPHAGLLSRSHQGKRAGCGQLTCEV